MHLVVDNSTGGDERLATTMADGLRATELLRRANGRLWQMPADAPLPDGAVEVTRRADREGGIERIIYKDGGLIGEVPGAVPRPPTLEESYGAFLALQGIETAPADLAEGAV